GVPLGLDRVGFLRGALWLAGRLRSEPGNPFGGSCAVQCMMDGSGFASSVCGKMLPAGFIASLTEPHAEACRREWFAPRSEEIRQLRRRMQCDFGKQFGQ